MKRSPVFCDNETLHKQQGDEKVYLFLRTKAAFCREVTHFRPQDNEDEIVAQILLEYLVL